MKAKKSKILIILSSVILFYFIICTGLYFFEPAEYNEPNLNDYQYYFDQYSKYSASSDRDWYIKQITTDDVTSADDNRIKYVDNTVIAVTENGCNYDDVTSLLTNYNHQICGIIPDINFYQIFFDKQMSFDKLLTLCENLSDSEVFQIVIPDYFEETPAEESTSTVDELYSGYYDIVNLEEAWQLFGDTEPVNIGIIDFYVDKYSDYLNIANGDEYSTDILYSDYYGGTYGTSVSHGTHIAGIIGATHSSDAPGVIKNAPIYSYNGINVSTSYWIASLYDMIVNNDVKSINISMAFNPYITMSASLGCENAITHIENEKILFSAILSNIIDNGYEFVICPAAGNDNASSAYRTYGGYFKYGDKKLLGKLDIFGIFDSKPDYVDAKYAYFFSDCPDKKVADRIIVVGAVDKNGDYCSFSNVGKVDIAAPGEYIYSTSLNFRYEYMTGTSMAAPFVTGAAAMLFSLDSDLTGAEVKEILISSATETVSKEGFTYSILNIGNAVRTLVPVE